jgi:hypothetical protein
LAWFTGEVPVLVLLCGLHFIFCYAAASAQRVNQESGQATKKFFCEPLDPVWWWQELDKRISATQNTAHNRECLEEAAAGCAAAAAPCLPLLLRLATVVNLSTAVAPALSTCTVWNSS